MFVQHSVHIEWPIQAVTSALVKSPRTWFPRIDSWSGAVVGSSVGGVGIRKKVVVNVGEPVKSGSWIEVPVTWHAKSIRRLFPVMTGKVELAPVDARITRLTVCGMYDPPLGKVGKHLDDALMHKFAEATVRELADSIAKRLDAAVSMQA